MNNKLFYIIWLTGAFFVLVLGIISNFPEKKFVSHIKGLTPVDRTLPSGASMFRLLCNSAEIIPEGETYTVRAKKGEDEMALFMISLGCLPKCIAIPSSYYGKDFSEIGKRARYLIVYHNEINPGESYFLVKEFMDGSLYCRKGVSQ
jgi:hypothetical protein